MAQVPYSPVPSERQSGAGLPDLKPSIPSGAFGGEIAAAVSGLGKTVASVGDDIYNRALWLQNLNNTAEAKQADAQYMVQAGKLHAEYGALEGADAVKAYPSYVKNLQVLRQQIRGGLSTAMSQRMYDSDTLSTLSRTIFNGAGRAATAQKQYVNSAIDAKRQANMNFAGQNPEDEGATAEALRENEVLTRQKGDLAGQPPEVVDNEIAQGASKIWANRIYELARTKPFEAQKMLDENKGKLWYTDANKVEEFVRQQQYSVGARAIANEETADLYRDNRNKPPERGLEERVSAAREKAAKARPDDPDYQFQVEQTVRSMFTRRKQDLKDTQQGNITTVAAGVIGDFGGKIPTTVEELRALDPAVAKAWDDLPATKRSPVLKALANNAKGDYAADEKNYREYMKLRGMATSDNAEERDAFMQTSIVDQALPMKWRTSLNKMQEALIRAGGGDVQVSKAMRQLTDAGIVPDPRDKDATLIYRGALQEALDVFREQNSNRPPKFEELKQIGAQLMSNTRDPERWTFGGLRSGNVPFYTLSVPSDAVERIKNDPKLKQLGIEVTDEQIKREYLRSQYIKLYGGSIRSGANAGAPIPITGPQPPVSQ